MKGGSRSGVVSELVSVLVSSPSNQTATLYFDAVHPVCTTTSLLMAYWKIYCMCLRLKQIQISYRKPLWLAT